MTAMCISDKVRRAIISAYSGKCQYCGQAAEPAHIDHIVARANGGADDLLNFTLACESCNLRKTALRLPAAYEGLLLAIAEQKLSAVVASIKAASRPKTAPKPMKPTVEASWRFLGTAGLPDAAVSGLLQIQKALWADGVKRTHIENFGSTTFSEGAILNVPCSVIDEVWRYSIAVMVHCPGAPNQKTGSCKMVCGSMTTVRNGVEVLVHVDLMNWIVDAMISYSADDFLWLLNNDLILKNNNEMAERRDFLSRKRVA